MRYLAATEINELRFIVKAHMQERGLSQREFAEMVFVRPKHMSHMLNGHKPITIQMLMHMLRVLDVAIVLDGRHEEAPAQQRA